MLQLLCSEPAAWPGRVGIANMRELLCPAARSWRPCSAQVTELAPLALLPACLLRSKVLRPMRFMAGGTMLVRQGTRLQALAWAGSQAGMVGGCATCLPLYRHPASKRCGGSSQGQVRPPRSAAGRGAGAGAGVGHQPGGWDAPRLARRRRRLVSCARWRCQGGAQGARLPQLYTLPQACAQLDLPPLKLCYNRTRWHDALLCFSPNVLQVRVR